MAHSHFTDCRSFTGLKSGAEHDCDGAPFIEPIAANDLRVGKYCMIGDFPCKIRELNRAAPGKHGHAKLRTVGQGIFDGKKREAIFSAQSMVHVPVVRKFQDLQCVVKRDGLELKAQEGRFPPTFIFPTEAWFQNLNLEAGNHVTVSVITACGHYKITDVHPAATPASIGDDNIMSLHSQALSKKESRKRKKLMRKQSALETQN